ncbi:MAG: AAA family ATPase [Microbacteriaceae bacterium]|nr:AAA family ATPase [Microbacteriaceae bacterium]
MLRSFTTDRPFRALSTRPFGGGADSCVLGKRTVIYGRNGSGKTTLSELLRLSLQGPDACEGVTMTAAVRDGVTNASVRVEPRSFSSSIFVYNRYYVLDSLRLFLDGDGQSPSILKLGALNVEAAEQLASVRQSMSTLQQREDAVISTQRRLEKSQDSLEKDTKSEIISALSASDAGKYNSASFRIDRVRRLLAGGDHAQLDDQSLAREIKAASAATLEAIPLPALWTSPSADLRRMVNEELLGLPVESVPIQRLADSKALSDWVESGLSLHEVGDTCAFCLQGTVTAPLLDGYRKHFSDALNSLRERLRKAIDYFENLQQRIDDLLLAIPTAGLVLVDYREDAQKEGDELREAATRLRSEADEALLLIRERLADPLEPLGENHRLEHDFSKVDLTELLKVLKSNNDACDSQLGRKKTAQEKVEGHYAAACHDEYTQVLQRIEAAKRATTTIRRRAGKLTERARELEESQEDTGRMASAIDSDLREQFGLGHLNLTVSDDGKGYVVRRNGATARRLSEGERNAIAFAYFLRSLEAEGIVPEEAIVVIDDPVSSMDKEALFAGFALAEERTKGFAQTIFLTHDYEYFRLQLGHLKSRRENSEKKIREGDKSEESYPAVSVLEVFATVDPATRLRTSSLRQLPRGLLQHPSEYHYLFRKVAEAVVEEHPDTLPLLGNAARRLLDGFISFRAPNGNDFQARVDSIARESGIDPVLSRRVVKFLHGQSHREEPRPTSALDFPSTVSELQAALDFIRRADPNHFSAMCKAVEIDASALNLQASTNVSVA